MVTRLAIHHFPAPERVAPLRTLVRELAARGEDAGMGLAPADGAVVFRHDWCLIVARPAPT